LAAGWVLIVIAVGPFHYCLVGLWAGKKVLKVAFSAGMMADCFVGCLLG